MDSLYGFIVWNHLYGITAWDHCMDSLYGIIVWDHCWLVRVSLFIELGGPSVSGKGWRGDLGTFMISRPN